METGSCPICDKPAESTFERDAIAYFDCSACGFRFSRQPTNPNLSQRLDEFESAYLRYLDDDPADEQNFSRLVRTLSVSPHGTWLDVGCGGGKLVRYLRQRGFDAEGIEPSEALYARFLTDEPFFHRDIAAVSGRRFDVVSALDVIEHVDDPVAFLASLRDSVQPTGTIVISTPDVAGAAARVLGKRWHHYNRYHSSFFSAATLDRAARRAGLRLGSLSHPGRRRSLGYTVRYVFEFGLGSNAPRIARRLDRIHVPINLGDVLLATLSSRWQ